MISCMHLSELVYEQCSDKELMVKPFWKTLFHKEMSENLGNIKMFTFIALENLVIH